MGGDAPKGCTTNGASVYGGTHYVCDSDPVKGGLHDNNGHPDTASVKASEKAGGGPAFEIAGTNRTEVAVNAAYAGAPKPGRDRTVIPVKVFNPSPRPPM
jgi:hypothetical protein